MARYYAVMDSLVGCLPDGSPTIFTRKGDARAELSWIAEGYKEVGLKVEGSKKAGAYYLPEQGRYIELADITNRVRQCEDCTLEEKGYCYRCDDTGLEIF